MNEPSLSKPKSYSNTSIIKMRIERFDSIFFNMSVTCLALAFIISIASFLLPVIAGLIIAMLCLFVLIAMLFFIIISFGTLLFTETGPLQSLYEFLTTIGGFFEKVALLSNLIHKLTPFLCITGLVSSVLSIIFSAIHKKQKLVGKIIGLSFIIIILTIILILFYAMGGILWQN